MPNAPPVALLVYGDLDAVALVGANHERLDGVVAQARGDGARCLLRAHGAHAVREHVHLAERVVVAEAVERDPDVDGLHVEVTHRSVGGAGPERAGAGGDATAHAEAAEADEGQAERRSGGCQAARETVRPPRRCGAPACEEHDDGGDGQGDGEGEDAVPQHVCRGRELRARVVDVAAEEPGVHRMPGGEDRSRGEAEERRGRGGSQARSDTSRRAESI